MKVSQLQSLSRLYKRKLLIRICPACLENIFHLRNRISRTAGSDKDWIWYYSMALRIYTLRFNFHLLMHKMTFLLLIALWNTATTLPSNTTKRYSITVGPTKPSMIAVAYPPEKSIQSIISHSSCRLETLLEAFGNTYFTICSAIELWLCNTATFYTVEITCDSRNVLKAMVKVLNGNVFFKWINTNGC